MNPLEGYYLKKDSKKTKRSLITPLIGSILMLAIGLNASCAEESLGNTATKVETLEIERITSLIEPRGLQLTRPTIGSLL